MKRNNFNTHFDATFISQRPMTGLIKNYIKPPQQPKLHQCQRCPALIKRNSKYCIPCGEEVRAEKQAMYQKRKQQNNTRLLTNSLL